MLSVVWVYRKLAVILVAFNRLNTLYSWCLYVIVSLLSFQRFTFYYNYVLVTSKL